MDERSDRAGAFLETCGWASARRELIAGDASNRRYFRLCQGEDRAVLMDAPPKTGEDVRPFVHVARYLTAQSFSAPAILACDADNGFLLLEDLGDDLFARLVAEDPAREEMLYTEATEFLVALHKAPLADLAPYDARDMVEQATLVLDWYAGTGGQGHMLRGRFCEELHWLLAPLDDVPRVVMLRDFHAENLIWLPKRDGVARVGLLDFQDARLCHPAYDLVSILQDARRDLSEGLEESMIRHYLARTGADEDTFRDAYRSLGLQRSLRILGIFARLCLSFGKPQYVDLIPRVWGYLMRNLHGPMTEIVTELLPEPTPARLQMMKEKCGTRPFPS